MRSDLIFGALAHVTNRYTLCQLASKATRKLHKPNTRLQDTTNEVLVRFHHESRRQHPSPLPRKPLSSSSAAQRKARPCSGPSSHPSNNFRTCFNQLDSFPINPS